VIREAEAIHKPPLHEEPLPFRITGDKSDTLTWMRSGWKLEDGWLVGHNAGEFGGGLWYFTSNGSQRQKLSDENVVGFVNLSGRRLALVGLAHLGLNNGEVLHIQDKGDNRKAVSILDLDSEPQAYLKTSDRDMVVVTWDGVVRVNAFGKADWLMKGEDTIWYANSIISDPNGVLYVGMRHYVLRLTPTGNGYKEEWFQKRPNS
jgi:hypothetical protein